MIARPTSGHRTFGAAQHSPEEMALGAAKRDAEFYYRQVAYKYDRHPDPNRRVHPLALTIRLAYEAAQNATARPKNPAKPGPSVAAQTKAWNALEKRMREIAALSGDELAAAIAEQERTVAEIQAETLKRIPPPPPAPHPAAALIEELQRRGVSLVVAEGKIIATPIGLLLRSDMNALREQKTDLIRFLTRDQVEI